MTGQPIKNSRTGEQYIAYNHASGLKIFIYPKEGYTSTIALFGTHFGSIDNRFKILDESDFRTVPAGIAHFLEHKLFENEKGDAFARYAKTGASANAFTSHDVTCYHFTATEQFEDSLEILLDFVTHPYFTAETVEKEQGIIGQEIRMYDDDPQWRVFFNLLAALYQAHPVNIDIAGTTDSISDITPDILYRCYRGYYNLSNMVLCVAGKVDPNTVLQMADRMLQPCEAVNLGRDTVKEPDAPGQREVIKQLAVAVPLFCIGYKETADDLPKASRSAAMETLLEAIAGESSPLYRELTVAGLINSEFGSEFMNGRGYCVSLFSGESRDPKAVLDKIKEKINAYKQTGIDQTSFARAKKAVYGRSLAGLNSLDSVARHMMMAHFAGETLFDPLEQAAALTLGDVNNALHTHLRQNCLAISIVEPNEGGDAQ